jgi:hypothetical protein
MAKGDDTQGTAGNADKRTYGLGRLSIWAVTLLLATGSFLTPHTTAPDTYERPAPRVLAQPMVMVAAGHEALTAASGLKAASWDGMVYTSSAGNRVLLPHSASVVQYTSVAAMRAHTTPLSVARRSAYKSISHGLHHSARTPVVPLRARLASPYVGRSSTRFTWVIDVLPRGTQYVYLSGCWSGRAVRRVNVRSAKRRGIPTILTPTSGIVRIGPFATSRAPWRVNVAFTHATRATPVGAVMVSATRSKGTSRHIVMAGPPCTVHVLGARDVPTPVADGIAHDIGPHRGSARLTVTLLLATASGGLNVPPVSMARARSWTRAEGLTIGAQDAVLGRLDVTGRTDRLAAAFKVQIADYRIGPRKRAQTFFSNARPPILPRGVGIIGVLGLSDLPTVSSSSQTREMPADPAGCLGPCFQPNDFRHAYGATGLHGDARGQTVGIIFWGGRISDRSLKMFAARTNTPVLRTGMSGPDTIEWRTVDPGCPHPGAEDELAMDVEYVHVMAPHSHIVVWLARSFLDPKTGNISSDDIGLERAIRAAARDRFVPIVSNSWGQDEAALNGDRSYIAAVDQDLLYARRRGATFLFGSGDHGALSGCRGYKRTSCIHVRISSPGSNGSGDTVGYGPSVDDEYIAQPPYPAENPNVLSVGGTNMETNSLREHAWGPKFNAVALGSSGGGCSWTYTYPAWQVATAGSPLGPPPCASRGVPDVAAFSDLVPGAYVFNGGAMNMGGTSLATPIWAGLLADLDAYLIRAHRSPTGFAAPGLYQLASKSVTYERDFHDQTDYGDLETTNGYPAMKGWDKVTGLGSPNLAHLEEDWAATDGGQRIYLSPRIDAVHFGGAGRNLHIVVTGKEFGPAPRKLPYTGNLCCGTFAFRDLTRSSRDLTRYWEAGGYGDYSDPVTLRYTSWNDRRIVIDGFGRGYGHDGLVVSPGDRVEILITDVATQQGATWRGMLPSAATASSVPDRGAPGDAVTISGKGFDPRQAIALSLCAGIQPACEASVSLYAKGSVRSDNQGSFVAKTVISAQANALTGAHFFIQAKVSGVQTFTTGGTETSAKRAAYARFNLRRSTPTSMPTNTPNGCPSSWTCEDIGSPHVTGTQVLTTTTDGITWTVQGAGGIGNNTDIFHYVWQPLTGDGTARARVTGATTIGEYEAADAGVMLRASSDPDAPYYFAYFVPTFQGGIVFVDYRDGQGHTVQRLATLRPRGVPVYLGVKRAGNSFTAYTSDDGATWAPLNGSRVTLAVMGHTVEAGLAAASFQIGWLTTATFDHVSVGNNAFAPVPDTCPHGWTCQDIGAGWPGTQALTTAADSITWTVQGAGGIANNADTFHYVWQPLRGDGTARARVTGLTTNGEYESAQAGVMLRASSDPGAPYYFAYFVPTFQGGIVFVDYRDGQGHTTQRLVDLRPRNAPVYLGVARSGTTFTAYTSDDGTTWAPLNGSGVNLMAMGHGVEAGLAAASNMTGFLSTATFDHVSVGS